MIEPQNIINGVFAGCICFSVMYTSYIYNKLKPKQ